MNGLEALEEIKKAKAYEIDIPYTGGCLYENSTYCEDCDIIESELKVLQILKEKKVDIALLFAIHNSSKLNPTYDLNYYNSLRDNANRLSKQEYTAIVEWLKGE